LIVAWNSDDWFFELISTIMVV